MQASSALVGVTLFKPPYIDIIATPPILTYKPSLWALTLNSEYVAIIRKSVVKSMLTFRNTKFENGKYKINVNLAIVKSETKIKKIVYSETEIEEL